MPLPTPDKNESESDFITRCLADETVKNDFAGENQRLAVCYAQWRRDKPQTLGKLQYCVRAQAVEQDGKKYALIEVIDENISGPCESPPGTKVRINPAGKARALGSLLDKPLLGPPELAHEATQVVGHPVDFTSNHATRVLYEIPDSGNWDRIDRGEWGPVSPKMTPIKAHYEGDTFVLDEWTWDNVAFVPKGAFLNAGVKSTCIDDPRLCGFTPEKPYGFYGAIAAALDSQSRLKAQRPRTETDVAHYSPEGKQVDREKTGGPPGGVTMEKYEHEKVIAELTDKNTKLDAEVKDLKAKAAELTKTNEKLGAEVKDLKAKAAAPAAEAKPAAPVAASDAMVAVQAELKAVKAEYEGLKAWKVAAEDADHMHRVQDVVDLRIKNGVLDAKNVQAAVESLKKLPNDALDAMKADLEAVKGKFDSLPSGPKARLIPSVAARFDPMQATIGDLVGKKPGEK
jgi:regulator of replication initiation timing